jgi:essential nuclear protein 1
MFLWTAPDSKMYRYGADITPEQKDALLDVIRVTHHPQISSEVRRELVNSVARGEPET